jgi:FHA domain
MPCVCCGNASEVGALCRACALEVVPCEGLIAEHIASKGDAAGADAWIVDGFGGAHAVHSPTTIGRDFNSAQITLLAASVSREHARLVKAEAGWTVADLGSRNGTLLGGVRIEGVVPLPARALLKVGDVTLWFLAKAVEGVPPPRELTTGAPAGGLVRYQFSRGKTELSIVTGNDTTTGGALLWRPAGTQEWSERKLARLEFQLLRMLCIRAYAESSSPMMVRGCVPTKQLLSELPFQSKYANQENVRQVVLRVRTVLNEVGANGALAVEPGRGYYLACTVTAVGADRR